jgi:hypothetical protein
LAADWWLSTIRDASFRPRSAVRFLELFPRHVKTPAPAAFVDTGCVPAVEQHRDRGRLGRHSAGVPYLARLETSVRAYSPSSNPVIGPGKSGFGGGPLRPRYHSTQRCRKSPNGLDLVMGQN